MDSALGCMGILIIPALILGVVAFMTLTREALSLEPADSN